MLIVILYSYMNICLPRIVVCPSVSPTLTRPSRPGGTLLLTVVYLYVYL